MTDFDSVRVDEAALELRLRGDWTLGCDLPSPDKLTAILDQPPPLRRLRFTSSQLGRWDTALVAFVDRTARTASERGLALDLSGLPAGVQKLMALAGAGGEHGGEPPQPRPPLVARLGLTVESLAASLRETVEFLGQATQAVGRFLSGRARFRGVDLVHELEQAGAGALGIVTVVSFLLGMILAFVGSVTLRPFGASIYVANVVAVATVRELGAVMTAIVMAGRTGSAYAAQLGTMRVTQEIDAVRTMGIDPFDFLVLPRLLALMVMMPLLCIYADFVSLAGGALVAAGMLDITAQQYLMQTHTAFHLSTFWLGVSKSVIFGILVSIAGCFHGLRSGRSAAAVGEAATRTVVSSIVAIIVADGFFAVICNTLGI